MADYEDPFKAIEEKKKKLNEQISKLNEDARALMARTVDIKLKPLLDFIAIVKDSDTAEADLEQYVYPKLRDLLPVSSGRGKGKAKAKQGKAFPEATIDEVVAIIKAAKGEPVVGRTTIAEALEKKSKSMPAGYGKKLAENKSIKISGKTPWQAFAWKD